MDAELIATHNKTAPSVVVVTVERDPKTMDGLPREIEQILQSPETGGVIVPSEQGSGFVIDVEGHIVTNKHVIDNALPNGIKIKLNDKKEYPARIVGCDGDADIAILKIDATGLSPIEIGDSGTVQVGQIVCALGSPYRLQDTFTCGVVSAVGRTDLTDATHYEEYIQTDASIHPGNSGGPLCDSHGRVIGVNTMINGINRGLGFAIPINVAKEIAKEIIEHGEVIRPALDIEIINLTRDSTYARYYAPLKSGALVAGLKIDSSAYQSGLRAGDAIIQADGVEVAGKNELQKIVLSKKVGDILKLTVCRDGKTVNLKVPLKNKGGNITHSKLASIPSGPPAAKPEQLPLGLEFVKDKKQVVVDRIAPHSLGSAANIQIGDVITSVGQTAVKNGDELMKAIQKADIVKGAVLHIERGGRTGFVIIAK